MLFRSTKSILEQAGFRDVRVERLETVMWMGADPDEATTQALSIGPLARALVDIDKDLREKIRAVVKARLADFLVSGNIAPPAACWLVGARA